MRRTRSAVVRPFWSSTLFSRENASGIVRFLTYFTAEGTFLPTGEIAVRDLDEDGALDGTVGRELFNAFAFFLCQKASTRFPELSRSVPSVRSASGRMTFR